MYGQKINASVVYIPLNQDAPPVLYDQRGETDVVGQERLPGALAGPHQGGLQPYGIFTNNLFLQKVGK